MRKPRTSALAVVEHERAPVGVLAPLRVGVLVERRAVVAGEGAVVAREVGGHPVDDHAEAALVEVVDEPAEVVGVAEARGGRVEAGDLVAPRRLVGVLGHRHELDVGEPEGGGVVGERAAPARGRTGRGRRRGGATSRGAPRRRSCGRATGSASSRRAIHSPSCHSWLALEHDARHAAGVLGELRHRVGAVDGATVGAGDRVLVRRAGADAGHEAAPHAGVERARAGTPAGPSR